MMKRILFIAAMLCSVAYGQSKGYLRYDSVYIQKIGGNGELILENGTRNVTGGVLTNMGNGRTQFVVPSGGGGDSTFGVKDTTFSANRFVNQEGNDFSFIGPGKVKVRADLAPYGSRYVYNSATVTDNTPSATATIDASGIRLQGGGNNLNNYVLLEDSIGAHNWTLAGSFVANEKSSTSLGLCFAFDGMGNGQNFYTFFQLADTSGYINGNLAASLPTGAEVNNRGVYTLKWSALDTFDFSISRTSYKGYIRLVNRATNSATILNMPELQVAVADLRIYTLGGDWKILNNLTLTYHDPKFPKWVFGGNSTSTGLTGTSEATTPYNISFDGVNDGVVDFSAATTQSADALFLIKDIIAFAPQYFIIPWGVTDRNGGVSAATYGANLRTIRNALIAAGITPIFVNSIPQNGGSMVPYNDTMLTVANETGSLYIDVYTALVGAGTSLNSNYDWGDGIHLNQLGNDVKGNAIRQGLVDAGLLTFDSPFSIGTLPVSARHNYIAGYDEKGNFTKVVAGTDPNYLRVYPDINIGTRYTSGNAYLRGDLWAKTVSFGDNPSGTNGYFQVNSSGQTIASHFQTRNGTVIISNSSIFFSGRSIQLLMNGATHSEFNPASESFIIRQTTPNATNVNLVVNTNSGNNINGNYKIAAFGVNTDTLTWLDRAGGVRVSDTTSGYTFAPDYNDLGENDWPTINIVDSLIAAGAGGFANPMTTAGDIITGGASGTPQRLAAGTENFVLKIVSGVPAWAAESGGGGSTVFSDLTAASATNTINNAAHEQEWQWNTLAGTEGLNLTSTSTAAASNAQRLFAVSLSGANANSAQTTAAGYFSNTHTGTTSNNYGIHSIASGGTANVAAYLGTAAGNTDGRLVVNGATDDANHTMVLRNISNTNDRGIKVMPLNESQNIVYGWNGVRGSTSTTYSTASGHVLLQPAGGVGVGAGLSVPVAHLEIIAGTTSRGPLKLTSGTSLTTPVAGSVEFTTDDLFFTITTGTARKRFILADQTAGLTSGTVPVATTNGRLTDGLIIASATYSPTLTNVTNVTGSTLQSASYTRVGSIVTVTIKVEVDATGAGATELGISLPVASNFADIDEVRGNVTEDTEVGAVEADITNDRIKLTYSAQGAGTDMFSIVLQYTII